MKKILIFIMAALCFGNLIGHAQLFSSKKNISTTGDYPIAIESGNINNDNYPDILIGTINNTVEWYKNNGNSTFTKQSNISSSLSVARSLAIADLDGDLDNDVIAISNTANKLVWYENDGNGNFGSEQIISTSFDRPIAIKIGKIDGNNTIDIAVVEYDGNQVVWFANNGNGTFSSTNVIMAPSVITKPRNLDMADFDKDGDLDVVIAFFQTKNIILCYNDLVQTGSVTFNQVDVVASSITGLVDVTFADVDDDNQLDVIAVAGSSNIVNWYKSNGTGNYTTYSLAPTNNTPSFAMVDDLNDDNKNDVMVSYASSLETNDELSWFQSSSPGTFMSENVIDNSQDDVLFTLNDFDNDGDLDVASIATSQNSLNWFENNTYSSTLSSDDLIKNPFIIYPNPTQDKLNFKGFDAQKLKISIYNILGEKIMNTSLNLNNGLDVSNLNNGIYIIEFENFNTTYKFVKN